MLRGEIYLASTVASKILGGLCFSKEIRGIAQLADRELEIFRLVGCGLTTREIAAQLSLGISTIETYRARIKTKLRLENASCLYHEAIRFAMDDQGNHTSPNSSGPFRFALNRKCSGFRYIYLAACSG